MFTGEFQDISPNSTSFVLGTDFNPFSEFTEFGILPFVGEATGLLQAAGGGNQPSDFSYFVSGNIALMERGEGTYFSTKINNAEAAGAIAAIIYNSGLGDPGVAPHGVLAASTNIPAILISRNLGLGFVDRLNGVSPDQIMVRVAVSAVPESSSVAVWSLLSMVGVGYGWRRKRRISASWEPPLLLRTTRITRRDRASSFSSEITMAFRSTQCGGSQAVGTRRLC